jgi:hypothetical protein
VLLQAKDGLRGKLLDLDDNKEISGIKWVKFHSHKAAWTEQGEQCVEGNGTFEAYQLDRDGKPRRNDQGDYLTWWANARLRWIPREQQFRNLTPPPKTQRHRRMEALILDRRCMHYGCIRLAEWMTGDEVELPAQVTHGKRWTRAQTVNVRFWCPTHFQGPRLLDSRGEVVHVWEDGCNCHPDITDYGKGR